MKVKIYILLVIGLTGCSQVEYNIENSIKEKIIGNWKTNDFKGDWKETAFIFTFQDSTCSYIHPWGENSKYWVSQDTLNIQQPTYTGNNNGGNLTYKFLIDSITTENLFLKPITNVTKGLFTNYNEQNFDRLRLSKIKERNDWEIDRIGFYSTGCFGNCPSMYLEIDSTGKVLFKGKRHTLKEGLYTSALSELEFNLIKSEINCIQLDSLKKMYTAHWTDDQTCGVTIKTKDTIYESSAYGFNEEPIELRILFHRLMELYKNIILVKDTTINNEFKFEGFQYRAYPPPPPIVE